MTWQDIVDVSADEIRSIRLVAGDRTYQTYSPDRRVGDVSALFDHWGSGDRLFIGTHVDCVCPPLFLIAADSFEGAYYEMVDEHAEVLGIIIDDTALADYDQDELHFNGGGEPVDTDNLQLCELPNDAVIEELAVEGRPYRLTVDPDGYDAAAYLGASYSWSLAIYQLGEGTHYLTESDAWEIVESLTADDAWCPCLDPRSDLATELARLEMEVV